MTNPSKIKDPRFWRKWRASGAVSSGNEHRDKCLAIAARYELQGKLGEAMVMRVEAYNDHSNQKSVPKPPLGRPVLFHQAYEGTQECLYCGKPITEWGTIERCAARYDQAKLEDVTSH